MSEAVDWLRQELADDLDDMEGRTAGDWAQSALDTVLTPGLVARTTIHSCVYAINYGKKGAETTFSLFERPIRADWWRQRDDIQASLLSVLALGFFATRYLSVPADPLLGALVMLQCLPLVADPFAAVAGVGR